MTIKTSYTARNRARGDGGPTRRPSGSQRWPHPWAQAKAVAAGRRLNQVAQPSLAQHVQETRQWLTPRRVAQFGPRVAITWVLLYRRHRAVPTAAEVYRIAGIVASHPTPVPPPDEVIGGSVGWLADAWRQIIIDETTGALLVSTVS